MDSSDGAEPRLNSVFPPLPSSFMKDMEPTASLGPACLSPCSIPTAFSSPSSLPSPMPLVCRNPPPSLSQGTVWAEAGGVQVQPAVDLREMGCRVHRAGVQQWEGQWRRESVAADYTLGFAWEHGKERMAQVRGVGMTLSRHSCVPFTRWLGQNLVGMARTGLFTLPWAIVPFLWGVVSWQQQVNL